MGEERHANLLFKYRATLYFFDPANPVWLGAAGTVRDSCFLVHLKPTTVLTRIAERHLPPTGLQKASVVAYLQEAVVNALRGKTDSLVPHGLPTGALYYVRVAVDDAHTVSSDARPLLPVGCKQKSRTRQQVCGSLCDTEGRCLCNPFPQLTGREFYPPPPPHQP